MPATGVARVAPDSSDWDAVLLVEYPSRAAFSAMVAGPDCEAITEHSTRALSHAVLRPMTRW